MTHESHNAMPVEGTNTMRYRKIGRSATMLLAVLFLLPACSDLSSPNFNAEDLSDLTENPTRANVNAATQGMLITYGAYHAAPNGYLVLVGTLGRNAYNLDIADPRFVTDVLSAPLSASSPAFGGNFWSQPYSNIQMASRILQALDGLPEGEMTEAEQEGVRGFVKTIEALELLTIVSTRDVNCDGSLGCPIEAPEDPAELAPAVTKEAVFDEIITLLDEARGHLASAGAEFPFDLPLGFEGFDTPSTFMQANWAVEARVRVYRGGEFGDDSEFTAALTALNNSFVDQGASMDLGIYHSYGTGSGDTQNSLFQPSSSPNLRAHPSVVEDAEPGDARLEEKTRDVTFRQFQGVGSDVGFQLYNSLDAPIPIITNEELILLRAEANIGLENFGAADDDINFIRTEVAELPEKDVENMTPAEALDALLYEKRYSLLLEGGHRWIDLRRYGLLDRVPLDDPSHVRNAQFPIPINEQLARE